MSRIPKPASVASSSRLPVPASFSSTSIAKQQQLPPPQLAAARPPPPPAPSPLRETTNTVQPHSPPLSDDYETEYRRFSDETNLSFGDLLGEESLLNDQEMPMFSLAGGGNGADVTFSLSPIKKQTKMEPLPVTEEAEDLEWWKVPLDKGKEAMKEHVQHVQQVVESTEKPPTQTAPVAPQTPPSPFLYQPIRTAPTPPPPTPQAPELSNTNTSVSIEDVTPVEPEIPSFRETESYDDPPSLELPLEPLSPPAPPAVKEATIPHVPLVVTEVPSPAAQVTLVPAFDEPTETRAVTAPESGSQPSIASTSHSVPAHPSTATPAFKLDRRLSSTALSATTKRILAEAELRRSLSRSVGSRGVDSGNAAVMQEGRGEERETTKIGALAELTSRRRSLAFKALLSGQAAVEKAAVIAEQRTVADIDVDDDTPPSKKPSPAVSTNAFNESLSSSSFLLPPLGNVAATLTVVKETPAVASESTSTRWSGSRSNLTQEMESNTALEPPTILTSAEPHPLLSRSLDRQSCIVRPGQQPTQIVASTPLSPTEMRPPSATSASASALLGRPHSHRRTSSVISTLPVVAEEPRLAAPTPITSKDITTTTTVPAKRRLSELATAPSIVEAQVIAALPPVASLSSSQSRRSSVSLSPMFERVFSVPKSIAEEQALPVEEALLAGPAPTIALSASGEAFVSRPTSQTLRMAAEAVAQACRRRSSIVTPPAAPLDSADTTRANLSKSINRRLSVAAAPALQPTMKTSQQQAQVEPGADVLVEEASQAASMAMTTDHHHLSFNRGESLPCHLRPALAPPTFSPILASRHASPMVRSNRRVVMTSTPGPGWRAKMDSPDLSLEMSVIQGGGRDSFGSEEVAAPQEMSGTSIVGQGQEKEDEREHEDDQEPEHVRCPRLSLAAVSATSCTFEERPHLEVMAQQVPVVESTPASQPASATNEPPQPTAASELAPTLVARQVPQVQEGVVPLPAVPIITRRLSRASPILSDPLVLAPSPAAVQEALTEAPVAAMLASHASRASSEVLAAASDNAAEENVHSADSLASRQVDAALPPPIKRPAPSIVASSVVERPKSVGGAQPPPHLAKAPISTASRAPIAPSKSDFGKEKKRKAPAGTTLGLTVPKTYVSHGTEREMGRKERIQQRERERLEHEQREKASAPSGVDKDLERKKRIQQREKERLEMLEKEKAKELERKERIKKRTAETAVLAPRQPGVHKRPKVASSISAKCSRQSRSRPSLPTAPTAAVPSRRQSIPLTKAALEASASAAGPKVDLGRRISTYLENVVFVAGVEGDEAPHPVDFEKDADAVEEAIALAVSNVSHIDASMLVDEEVDAPEAPAQADVIQTEAAAATEMEAVEISHVVQTVEVFEAVDYRETSRISIPGAFDSQPFSDPSSPPEQVVEAGPGTAADPLNLQAIAPTPFFAAPSPAPPRSISGSSAAVNKGRHKSGRPEARPAPSRSTAKRPALSERNTNNLGRGPPAVSRPVAPSKTSKPTTAAPRPPAKTSKAVPFNFSTTGSKKRSAPAPASSDGDAHDGDTSVVFQERLSTWQAREMAPSSGAVDSVLNSSEVTRKRVKLQPTAAQRSAVEQAVESQSWAAKQRQREEQNRRVKEERRKREEEEERVKLAQFRASLKAVKANPVPKALQRDQMAKKPSRPLAR